MKKAEYIVDSFKDFTGVERQFVMAAVSLHGEPDIYIEEDGDIIDNDEKVLSIGVSVCRPDDEFNETLGKTIAEGKATKYRNHALYAVDAGLINETMVKALLQQEAEYFKVNPGRYLAGYDRDAEKYHRSTRIESYIDTLSGEAETTFKYLTEASDEEMEKMAEAVNYVLGE